MGTLLKQVLAGARVVLLAVLIYLVYPIVKEFGSDGFTAKQAVNSLLADKIILVVIAMVVLGIAVSLLDSPAVRSFVTAGTLLLGFLLITGRVSVGEVKDRVNDYTRANDIIAAAKACGLDADVKRIGDGVRTILRDGEDRRRIVGYLEGDSRTIVDSEGRPVRSDCRL